jgi:hypothetical protein
MKTIFPIWLVSWLLISCSTINKMASESFHHALIGQNESTIYSRLGPPTRIITDSSGGKILIYEHYSKGTFLTPNKSKVTYSARRDMSGNREGFTFHSGVNTVTNNPEYTIYQREVSSLKVFLDKNGSSFKFEQSLPREVLETYHERLKHFPPEAW